MSNDTGITKETTGKKREIRNRKGIQDKKENRKKKAENKSELRKRKRNYRKELRQNEKQHEKQNKNPINKKRLIIVIGLAILLVAAVAAGIVFLLGKGRKEEPAPEEIQVPIEETKPVTEPEEEEIAVGNHVLEHIITAGDAVDKAYKERPESFELTAENTATFAKISSCTIEGGSRVEVKASGAGIPVSDDKYYYLFAIDTYDTGISEEDEYIDKVYKNTEVTMTAALNYNSANSRLYKKFVLAVKKDDAFVQVSQPMYITNPEAIAKYGGVFTTPASKKGVLVDPSRLRGGELDDLGVKQAAYNIPVSRILGPSTSAAHPTIYYTYNGKTYSFNGQIIAEYDHVFSTLTSKGISTTAIILNDCTGAYAQLTHPNARSGSTAPYYMFNGAEQSGVDYIAAIGTFLAERYSNDRNGRISSWVIANEINARKEWNYIAHTDLQTYVNAYAQSFRVFYTAIKSVSSSAKIYMPIDQQWDRNIKNNTNYDGKDVLDEFNRNIKAGGNIDWGLSQHPYNVPLTEARIWKPTNYVKHNLSTSFITMDNIEVLTNYMEQEQFRNQHGEVRSIILSEQGYTSTSGEALQAAAFAYAYYKVEANPHIDSFLLNRQTDAPEEVAQGLAFGLNHYGGGHKQIYTVFKYIDTPQHAQYTEFAKNIIGISSWSEIY